jgi:L-2-hydroxyglutarate oxidase
VAISRDEIPRLEAIYERGCANGVPVERLSPEQLKELEPAAAGMLALHVKSSGVADFRGIGEKLRERIEQLGGRVICGAAVQAIESSTAPIRIITTKGDFSAKHMVNCAGLYSDKIFAMCGENPDIRIIPFRGDYFLLNDTAASLCRSLIYPVPNPAFPFLGVHFTRGVYDEVDCGPNAVLAFAREGYTLKRINLRESWESLCYAGFRQLIRSQWREAVRELMLSLSKRMFIKAAQRLIPDIREKDLIAAPSGVRAQAVSRTGKVIDDYIIKFTSNGTHVLNAPSPAATSCLSIGLRLAEQLPLQRGKVVNGTI